MQHIVWKINISVSSLDFNVWPNVFFKYEIVKWDQKKGLKNFMLGGWYGTGDGIFRYKHWLALNDLYDFYIGRKVFDKYVND